ncbi:hypothetical protein [Cellulomonas endophytica]|uniref:hypothetical protein n=1 Tax=Cellulomonas endophytica TaxID=2494735 RepID=UPI001012A057|nr:hypothetical protein [Cellulomonas endophytica]
MSEAVGPGSLLAGRYRLGAPVPGDLPGASTWDATDQILDRPVRAVLLHTGAVARALDAARRAALVLDPRLVRVVDVGTHTAEDGTATGYVVTEHVDGPDLARLAAHGPLTGEQARALVGEAAAALEVARRRGVHHLALRPSALHVTPGGRVVLTGLGLDGALLGRTDTDARRTSRADTLDLVRLLYAALTGRWPAPPGTAGPDEGPGPVSGPVSGPRRGPVSGPDRDEDGTTAAGDTLARGGAVAVASLPPAPVVDGVAVPPADLVVGVPNDLDTLCAVTLGPHDDGPHTPGDLVQDLEPWGEIRASRATPGGGAEIVLSGAADAAAPDAHTGADAPGPWAEPAAAGAGAGVAAAGAAAVVTGAAAGRSGTGTGLGWGVVRSWAEVMGLGGHRHGSDGSAPADGDRDEGADEGADDGADGRSAVAPGATAPEHGRTAGGEGHDVGVDGAQGHEAGHDDASPSGATHPGDGSGPVPGAGASADPGTGTGTGTGIGTGTRTGTGTDTDADGAPDASPGSSDGPAAAVPPVRRTSVRTVLGSGDRRGDTRPGTPPPAFPPRHRPVRPVTGAVPRSAPGGGALGAATGAVAAAGGGSTLPDPFGPAARAATPPGGTPVVVRDADAGGAGASGPATGPTGTTTEPGPGAGGSTGAPDPTGPDARADVEEPAAHTGSVALADSVVDLGPGAVGEPAAPAGPRRVPVALRRQGGHPDEDAEELLPAPLVAPGGGAAGGAGGTVATTAGGAPVDGVPGDPGDVPGGEWDVIGQVDEDERPRRPRVDAPLVALLLVLLLVVGGVAFATRELFAPVRGDAAGDPAPTADAGTAAPEAPAAEAPPVEAPAPVAPVVAGLTSIDPSDPGAGEKEDVVGQAVDGDPATAWFTFTYRSSDFGGLKDAVGLAVTLQAPATVTTVTLRTNNTGGAVEVRATDTSAPTAGDVLASGPLAPETVLTLAAPTETASLVLWFTDLPPAPDGAQFRLEVAEVAVS